MELSLACLTDRHSQCPGSHGIVTVILGIDDESVLRKATNYKKRSKLHEGKGRAKMGLNQEGLSSRGFC
jgi:hypothetical protein